MLSWLLRARFVFRICDGYCDSQCDLWVANEEAVNALDRVVACAHITPWRVGDDGLEINESELCVCACV